MFTILVAEDDASLKKDMRKIKQGVVQSHFCF